MRWNNAGKVEFKSRAGVKATEYEVSALPSVHLQTEYNIRKALSVSAGGVRVSAV